MLRTTNQRESCSNSVASGTTASPSALSTPRMRCLRERSCSSDSWPSRWRRAGEPEALDQARHFHLRLIGRSRSAFSIERTDSRLPRRSRMRASRRRVFHGFGAAHRLALRPLQRRSDGRLAAATVELSSFRSTAGGACRADVVPSRAESTRFASVPPSQRVEAQTGSGNSAGGFPGVRARQGLEGNFAGQRDRKPVYVLVAEERVDRGHRLGRCPRTARSSRRGFLELLRQPDRPGRQPRAIGHHPPQHGQDLAGRQPADENVERQCIVPLGGRIGGRGTGTQRAQRPHRRFGDRGARAPRQLRRQIAEVDRRGGPRRTAHPGEIFVDRSRQAGRKSEGVDRGVRRGSVGAASRTWTPARALTQA